MVVSWNSSNCPLTKRRTRLDLPTAMSPSSTSLNWQILVCGSVPLERPPLPLELIPTRGGDGGVLGGLGLLPGAETGASGNQSRPLPPRQPEDVLVSLLSLLCLLHKWNMFWWLLPHVHISVSSLSPWIHNDPWWFVAWVNIIYHDTSLHYLKRVSLLFLKFA